MSRFVDTETKVQFTVDDSKDDRYAGPRFEKVDGEAKKPARKTAKPDA